MGKDCIVCHFALLHARDLLLEMRNGLSQTLSHAKFEVPTFFPSRETELDRIRRICIEKGCMGCNFSFLHARDLLLEMYIVETRRCDSSR